MALAELLEATLAVLDKHRALDKIRKYISAGLWLRIEDILIVLGHCGALA